MPANSALLKILSYSPDPANPGKFIKTGEFEATPHIVRCDYCGGNTHSNQTACENCGGPTPQEKEKPKVPKQPKPNVTFEYR